MSERRTRRQTALAAASNNDETPAEDISDVSTNGNSIGNNDHAVATNKSTSTTQENIFLFWPNVIGMHSTPSYSIP